MSKYVAMINAYLWFIFLLGWSILAWMPIVDYLFGTSFTKDMAFYFQLGKGS